MISHEGQPISDWGGHMLSPKFDFLRQIKASADLFDLTSQPGVKKALNTCPFELPLDSVESRANDSSDCTMQESRDCEGSDSSTQQAKLVRFNSKQALPPPPPTYMICGEYEMGNNNLHLNNSQGVDMQNLPSVVEQMERNRTWMTLYFRYRMNWFEAKNSLCKMSREDAYKNANLHLWTRCVKIQLNRKSIFLHAIRAFRNRMQCGTSGVRFTMNAFYRASGRTRKSSGDNLDDIEAKPLPYFKTPNDMPDLKAMNIATMSVFVSNSTSFFDIFWDKSLKEINS